jgi:hypothetical protein
MIQFLEILKNQNEPVYYFGGLCLLCAIVCFIFTKTTQTQVWGISAWYKPMKFFLSSFFLIWSMGWYMQYLPDNQSVIAYSWGMIVFLTFENIYIAWRASQGELSHFNVKTPFNAAMYTLMAVASAGISFWTAYIGILFFSNKITNISEVYLWGIRLGIILFVLFSLQGFAMGGRMTHTIGGADGSEGLPVVNWSKKYGDLRIAHFLGMHALQVIPVLSFYVVRNVNMVFVLTFAYGIITLAVFIQALQGKPLFR